MDALAPLLAQAQPAAAGGIDAHERAGHRVEAGREDQQVELDHLAVGQPHAIRRDGLDRALVEVDERDVVAVERLEVAGVHAQPLGGERVGRHELLGELRILDPLPEPVLHPLPDNGVGLVVEQQSGYAAVMP